MLPFTDAQKLACDISRNIAVTAGAGSGKTSVLVERYLWCLQNNGYQVRRIAAITFTEKAAGEMLGRIRQRVIEYVQSELGDPQRWEDVLEKLPLANISTIHSFCQRLLREFPIEAGVDPNFEVFDEAVKQICLTRLIDDVIRQRAAAYDVQMAILAEPWTPSTLRNVLLQLMAFRDASLPWAKRILQETFPNYLHQLQTLLTDLQRRGIRQLAADPHWQETMTLIRSLIPSGDNSKLTSRCLNLLEYDEQFRTQTSHVEQLMTLRMLRNECRMVAASKKWQADGRNVQLAEALNQLKGLYDQRLPSFEVRADLEKSGFVIQQALAELLLAVYEEYQQEKIARRVLDFDDLQERTLGLLDQPAVHALLAHRYDYLMVDEFQDTNQLQWNLIRKLGTTAEGLAPNKFCIVGDEKQSIYMFRGAEVAVFRDVRQELQQANRTHQVLTVAPRIPAFGEMPAVQETQQTGELILAENFRSLPPLIFFFNTFFARIFLPSIDPERPYEIPHQELIARRKLPSHVINHVAIPTKPVETGSVGNVEFLFVHRQEGSSAEQAPLDEPELVALRIQELAQTVPYADIAILLRTRTRLKEFENALRRYAIPFVVAGGIGFYQQQEIYDLANLLRVLVDYRQDIALAGVLRSPLFSFSDDQLLYVASEVKEEIPFTPPLTDVENLIGETTPFALSLSKDEGQGRSSTSSERMAHLLLRETTKQTLWEKLEHHANLTETIPAELDPPKFRHTYTLLRSWKAQANRIPITHLLRQILDATGLYGILSGGQREMQSFINIEKLLDITRTFEGAGFQTLNDFVTYLDLLIEFEEREGEAQINFEGMDAVRLMTIHAAKGLEFPVVIVPELERPFNYGTSGPVYIDTLKLEHERLPVIGIKGLDPEQHDAQENTILREYLKRINAEKTDAEMKRLLYVACTRAEDRLVFSGALSENLKNSWLSWLLDIFPLPEAIPARRLIIAADAESPQNSPSDHCLPGRGPGWVQELEIPIATSEDYEKRYSPSDHCLPGRGEGWVSQENGEIRDFAAKSRFDTPFDVSATLQHNLAPIRGGENEIFRINPSTVHTLLQCPRKFYYQEILKLPGLSGAQAVSGADAPEATNSDGPYQHNGKNRGTLIHRIFEKRWFDQEWRESELVAAMTTRLEELNVSEGERTQMRLDDAISRAYQNYKMSGLRELLSVAPKVYREYPFVLRIGRAEISGTLDVLFFDPQREMWTILDYKSNEIEPGRIGEEIGRHGYDRQMQMYALAVSRLFRTEHIRSLLFFTFPGCLYEAVDLSPNTLTALEISIVAFLDRLAEGVIEVSQKPVNCEDCVYRLYEERP